MKILFVLDYDRYKNELFSVAEKAAEYADYIWFRIKYQDDKTILNLAERLRRYLINKKLILSERADLALIIGFNGVHLGANSIPPEVIKQKFNSLTVGYSTHSIDEINSVTADYYTLSPIFDTKKDYEVKPLGLVNVTKLNKNIYALGGINRGNAKLLKDLGFCGVAGITFLSDLEMLKKEGWN